MELIVLPAAHRLRRSSDFHHVVRRGVRVGRASVVVHAARRPAEVAAESTDEVSRVGFVVSKAVGNAVVRNRVKRRLRALVRHELDLAGSTGPRIDWVIRALPPAATSDRLGADLGSAWRGCEKRLAR